MFTVIPVIDLIEGQVVYAKAGHREQYQPLCSPLCPSSSPVAVVGAFLSLHAFEMIYVADLDAIRGYRGNAAVIADLMQRFPQIHWWLDAGFRHARDLAGYGCKGFRPVIGSETLEEIGLLSAASAPILSLDFRQSRLVGPPTLWEGVALWPDDVLVMSLSQVGSNAGPDWTQLKSIQAHAGQRRLYAAGGVRHQDDLDQLAVAGISGALVATALHNGSLIFNPT